MKEWVGIELGGKVRGYWKLGKKIWRGFMGEMRKNRMEKVGIHSDLGGKERGRIRIKIKKVEKNIDIS